MTGRLGSRGTSTARSRLVRQFGRFLVVGLLSFAVDFGLFLVMHELLAIQYLVASTTSFAISLVLNYWLTLRFVFDARPGRNVAAEFVLYIGLNIVALGLNQLVLLLSVEVLAADPVVGKLIATAVVLVFNFISRKMLIERRGTAGSPTSVDSQPTAHTPPDSTESIAR